MRGLGAAVLVTASLTTVASGTHAAPGAPDEAAPRWARTARELPLAEVLGERLDGRSPRALRTYRRALLSRLLLDEGRLALHAPNDLHDAAVLALVSARLVASGEGTSGRANDLDAFRAAYVVHAAGHAWADRPAFRERVRRLPSSSEEERSARLFRALRDSAGELRGIGRRWFPEALHEALDANPDRHVLHHLRARWLEREARPEEAAEALERALELRSTLLGTLDLVRVLARQGKVEEARELAEGLRARAPGLEGPLARLLRREADRRASEAFEQAEEPPSRAERLAQARRYQRLEHPTRADAILRGLRREAAEAPAVRRLAAELWLAWGRFGRLDELLGELEAGSLAPPIREARIAAGVTARLRAARGGELGELGERPLEPFLDELSDRGPEGAQRARRLRVILAATARPREPEALAERTETLVAESPAPARAVRTVAAAWLALGDGDRAREVLSTRVDELDGAAGARARLRLAALEMAQGVKRRDRGLLQRGRRRLEGLDGLDGPGPEARRRYLEVVAPHAASHLRGAPQRAPGDEPGSEPSRDGPPRSERSPMEALLPLVDRVDPGTKAGGLTAQAAAVSAAGLVLADRREESAMTGPLQVARRVAPANALRRMAAGQVAMGAQDPTAAADAFERAIRASSEATLRFAAHKWAALAANRTGQPARMQRHMERMLTLWDRAGTATRKRDATPQPVLAGGAELAVELAEGEGLAIRADLMPLLVLLPDFQHDRQRIEQVTGSSDAERPPARQK